ncbi:MAG: hypothetical protein Q7S60_05455 [bacterium]|nr:hypothetical protein [bacterium]
MKTWTIRFRRKDKEIFDLVRNGAKDIETRAATPKYQKIKVGDNLVFSCGGEKFTKKVYRVAHYRTLAELFKNEELIRIMPWVNSKEEAERIIFSFSGYEGKIEKFGIVAWEFK